MFTRKILSLLLVTLTSCKTITKRESDLDSSSNMFEAQVTIPEYVERISFTRAMVNPDDSTDAREFFSFNTGQFVLVARIRCATNNQLRRAIAESSTSFYDSYRVGCIDNPDPKDMVQRPYFAIRPALLEAFKQDPVLKAKYQTLEGFEKAIGANGWANALVLTSHLASDLSPNQSFGVLAKALDVPDADTSNAKVIKCFADGTIDAERWNVIHKETIQMPLAEAILGGNYHNQRVAYTRNFEDFIPLYKTKNAVAWSESTNDWEIQSSLCETARKDLETRCVQDFVSPNDTRRAFPKGGTYYFKTETCRVNTECYCKTLGWSNSESLWK